MKTLRQGIIKRLHVDRSVLANNKKTGIIRPALTIQTSKGSIKTRSAMIHGVSYFVQADDNPLSCGVKVWVETFAEVTYE